MTLDYNKYNLLIRLNDYKKISQFQGNGLYSQYVEGCFKSGKFFKIYPIINVFYLAIGDVKHKLVEVDKEPVDNDDFINHERDPKIFIKYVNILIDRYLQNVKDEVLITPIR